MELAEAGWDERRQAEWTALGTEGASPARVAALDKGGLRLLTAEGEQPAISSGNLRKAPLAERPAVGDWVACKPTGDGRLLVTDVLPRRSAFTRRAAGEHDVEQVVAANVDTLFLVAGLDGDYSVRRIERTLTLAWESGARPVVVLNKADVVPDPEACLREVEAVAPGVSVHLVSARPKDGADRAAKGLEQLDAYLVPATTVALLGSSGVGKSTILNRLVGHEIAATGEVRESDSRGRHTTTRRELFRLPGGAWMIDTPGLRELQLWADPERVDQAFPEIQELAAACRFGDCRHGVEPGCEVQAAARDGRLPPERLASWQKLRAEVGALHARLDVFARRDKKARERSIHRLAWKHRPRGY